MRYFSDWVMEGALVVVVSFVHVGVFYIICNGRP